MSGGEILQEERKLFGILLGCQVRINRKNQVTGSSGRKSRKFCFSVISLRSAGENISHKTENK